MNLLLALALTLQVTVDPLLSRLVGQWSGTGTVLNQPSKIEMSWTSELGGQFVKLTFRNEMPKSVFEGHAYYRAVGPGQYRGMWFDNSGMFRPLDARRDGDALVSKWGTPDTEEGETTYRLQSDGKMEVVDRVKGKDGTWRQFGQSGLMKR
jgi:hypothetical protein